MIDAVREAGSNPILLSLPPIDAQKDTLHGFLKGRALKTFSNGSGMWSIFTGGTDVLSGGIRTEPGKECSSHQYYFNNLLEERNYHSFICDDGIHLNESGHRLVYQVLSDYIRRHEPVISLAV